ncbi:MAG: entericidin EcnA/B family protein [Alphaproteobacteria bacterium]|nr:MAG: entericidin EcnA/B family protein [Alphaproteobacteria bacterium]
MKMMLVALALVTVAVSLGACETVKGVGRDITGTGETVQGWF